MTSEIQLSQEIGRTIGIQGRGRNYMSIKDGNARRMASIRELQQQPFLGDVNVTIDFIVGSFLFYKVFVLPFFSHGDFTSSTFCLSYES